MKLHLLAGAVVLSLLGAATGKAGELDVEAAAATVGGVEEHAEKRHGVPRDLGKGQVFRLEPRNETHGKSQHHVGGPKNRRGKHRGERRREPRPPQSPREEERRRVLAARRSVKLATSRHLDMVGIPVDPSGEVYSSYSTSPYTGTYSYSSYSETGDSDSYSSDGNFTIEDKDGDEDGSEVTPEDYGSTTYSSSEYSSSGGGGYSSSGGGYSSGGYSSSEYGSSGYSSSGYSSDYSYSSPYSSGYSSYSSPYSSGYSSYSSDYSSYSSDYSSDYSSYSSYSSYGSSYSPSYYYSSPYSSYSSYSSPYSSYYGSYYYSSYSSYSYSTFSYYDYTSDYDYSSYVSWPDGYYETYSSYSPSYSSYSSSYSSYDEGSSDFILWPYVPCIDVDVRGKGTLIGEPSRSKLCWNLRSAPGTYIEMTVNVHPLDGHPWGCFEVENTKRMLAEMLTVRNRPPPSNRYMEERSNVLLRTCYKGAYRAMTEMETAHVRLHTEEKTESEGFEIEYEVKQCSEHPSGGCRHATPYPTPSVPDTVTPYPTVPPSERPPTPPPTMPDCDRLKENSGSFGLENYPNDARRCWQVKPDGEGPLDGVMRPVHLRVEMTDVEQINSGECMDFVTISALYTYKDGKREQEKRIAGPLCGKLLSTVYEIEPTLYVNDNYPAAALKYFTVGFRSDGLVSGEGFKVEFEFGGSDDEQVIVKSFAELNEAVKFATASVHTYIYIDAPVIYFDDSWDLIVRANRHFTLLPLPPRSKVIFDGSRKTQLGYFGEGGDPLPMEEQLIPRICDVREGGVVTFDRIHFRYFTADRAHVTQSIGLIHVASGGRIASIRDCEFSSNDARPVYKADEAESPTAEDEFSYTSKLELFPKGALIQVELGGQIDAIFRTVFRYNLHTVVANRGSIVSIDRCSFAANRASAAVAFADGSNTAVPGAVIANSRNLGKIEDTTFYMNDASLDIFESTRRIVDESQVLIFNPPQMML